MSGLQFRAAELVSTGFLKPFNCVRCEISVQNQEILSPEKINFCHILKNGIFVFPCGNGRKTFTVMPNLVFEDL